MITVTAKGLDTAALMLKGVERQIPFATALALTKTAQLVKKGILEVMEKRLDNPTKTTLNSLFIAPAKPKKLQAKVWLKDTFNAGIPADRYMQAVVYGGVRRRKRFEMALLARGLMSPNQYAIPQKPFLDQNGNIKGQLAIRILSGLGAAETVSGYSANATNSRRSRKKGNAGRYFVGDVDGSQGVWERKRIGSSTGVRPVFLFTDSAPKYKVIVPFFKVADNIIKANYSKEFSKALDRAIATAR